MFSLQKLKICRLIALVTLIQISCEAHFVDETLSNRELLCADDDAPVCARLGQKYVFFNNECQLEAAASKKRHDIILQEVSLGYCSPNCNFYCKSYNKPVCGISISTSQHRTFKNKCELARKNCQTADDWQIYSENACSADESNQRQLQRHTIYIERAKQRLPVPCTTVYRPVCATLGGVKSTFNNECHVNTESVKTGKKWIILYEGICEEDYNNLNYEKFPKFKDKNELRFKTERSKRSLDENTDDLDLGDNVVYILAPSTFNTEYINGISKIERNYMAPEYKPPQHESQRVNRTETDIIESLIDCKFSNEPICGSFNGETRTFAHECALMEYSKLTKNEWTILHEGMCRTCDFDCTNDYEPICANHNGINFTMINECFLRRLMCRDPYNEWKIVQEGECTVALLESIQDKDEATTKNVPLFDDNIENVSKSSRMELVYDHTVNGLIREHQLLPPVKKQHSTIKITSTTKSPFKIKSNINRKFAEVKKPILELQQKLDKTTITKNSPKAAIKKQQSISGLQTNETMNSTQSYLWEKISNLSLEATSQESVIKASTTTTKQPETESSTAATISESIVEKKMTNSGSRLSAAKNAHEIMHKKSENKPSNYIKNKGDPLVNLWPIIANDVSARTNTERTSLYGPNDNSIIMRLVRAKNWLFKQ